MTAQHYSDSGARARMAAGLCPECGSLRPHHTAKHRERNDLICDMSSEEIEECIHLYVSEVLAEEFANPPSDPIREYAPSVPEIKKHSYFPDYLAMGDCLKCGHVRDSSIHI